MTSNADTNDGVWFIYDGDCPICRDAARALRIKEKCGTLKIIDARTAIDSDLLQEINKRGYNLDDGMVIYHHGNYYHGAQALHFMAVHGDKKGFFNRFNVFFFRNETLAQYCYPFMLFIRNSLLLLRGKMPIHNLIDRSKPTFKSVFGDSWNDLPPVMHKHYANKPFSDDIYRCRGTMKVEASSLLSIFAPVFQALGGIPINNEEDVDVTVTFKSDINNPNLHFIREFSFKKQRPYVFHSVMVPSGDNKITEVTRMGLCWRSRFSWRDNRVILAHDGYAVSFFGRILPLPLTWMLGRVHAEERAVSDNTFQMFVEIRHWLFGKIYKYSGQFVMEPHDD